MMKKIIFLDVDGTLVDYEGRIPTSAAAAASATGSISVQAGARPRSILSCGTSAWTV